MVYTSIENKKIKQINKLKEKKHRDKESLFLIEGEHLIEEAIKHGYLETLILLEDSTYNYKNIMYVNNTVMAYLSELQTPNMIGICRKKENKNIGDKIVILDNVQDPGNLGTIIRSSKAFDIDTIILSKDCVDLYNSKVIRATQGMIFNTNIIITDIMDEIEKLKTDGIKIIGTRLNDAKNIKNVEICEKFAIIMGNEGTGVKKEILDACDEFVFIKMNNSVESLNVAVATSIILYEFSR